MIKYVVPKEQIKEYILSNKLIFKVGKNKIKQKGKYSFKYLLIKWNSAGINKNYLPNGEKLLTQISHYILVSKNEQEE